MCGGSFQFLPIVSSGSGKPAETVGPGHRDPVWRKFSDLPADELSGPTFVDDDTVLLCADSPSQLIDKICEATRIYVDTARNFGLTLNFDKGKTEALVS